MTDRIKPLFDLNGKVALITGGASGFGEGMAKLFAKEGAKIVIADLNDNAAAKVVSEIENWQPVFGGNHIAVPVCSPRQPRCNVCIRFPGARRVAAGESGHYASLAVAD